MMLSEGTMVYFLVNGYVMEGNVMNVEGTPSSYTFEIEGLGGCGGPQVLSNTQLHHTVFLTKEEAKQWITNEQAYISGHC